LLFELIKPILTPTPTPLPLSPEAGLSIMGIPLIIILCIIGFLIYWLPSFVAYGSRPRRRNAAAIFVLNAFLGWTFIGWVVALTWAFTHSKD
jgi:Superinfection immunity protein